MGIQGLLPFLKNASRPANVEEFRGKTAAIDVYCWLHKGAFGCADKLVQNQPTNGYVVYVIRYVDMLLHFNVKPILVFDGRNLPSKSETEKKRRESREKFKKMAKDFLRLGKLKEARDCFQRCIDITPKMAREVIDACTERNIDCIVAPYEADAQLAYLNISGIADFIISEDSDLAPFGCSKILFKMDLSGNGTLIEKEKLYTCLGIRVDNFTFEKFRFMCIMAGCDYHPSLPGIGIGKSCKFWGKVTNPDIRTVLPKIPGYLNMGQLEVTDEYIDGFIKANDTFLYQLVYDPKERKLRPLTEYPNYVENPLEKYRFAGDYVPDDLALQMALGNVDIHSLDVVNNFDPDRIKDSTREPKPRYGNRAQHPSMWWSDQNAMLKQPSSGLKSRDIPEVFLEGFRTKQIASSKSEDNFKKRKAKSFAKLKVESDEEISSESSILSENYSSVSKKYKQDVSFDGKYSADKVVVVSRYFSKNYHSESQTSSNGPVREKGGSWLEELDNDDFKRETIQEAEEIKENCQMTKLASFLKNDPATRKPFKPVVSQISSSVKVEEASKLRNPFAKVLNKKEPVEKDPEFLDFSQSPMEISSSQLSICSIDDDLPSQTRDVEKEAKQVTSVATLPNLVASSKSPPSILSESPYFKKVVPGGIGQPRPRVPVSGLYKKSKVKRIVDAKQPKIFELLSRSQL